ncbi:DHH family phosphoesterase [Vibrio aestuarianus]|uniref:DHH family phosphoesterase n=1 Tax=Vibrio aestuarianus TaxID=28171 RepID=A0AAX3U403_9VIBR|nr:DHH family phosphoesterase [Vibrio aestuarianus]NGZ67867.1 DHH family phosphoesterase [Vibrio aestuarianus subsp. cardii]WGK81639.1 DHH family phosphoesterase [Vibrio aestuarianus]
MHYDIFNGDADGIISLLQIRLAQPRTTTLITGVKRDIQLLEGLDFKSRDSLTVLDLSLNKNRTALQRALDMGVTVFYADHHQADDIPVSRLLDAHIDLDPDTCTALIVDKWLGGQFHEWAITAAYGDNLLAKADKLAIKAGLSINQAEQLKELGTLINYNGYGESVDQLHYHPANLYQALLVYPSPFDVIADLNSPFYHLQQAYEQDMQAAQSLTPIHRSQWLSVFELPDDAASHRVCGVFGNWLANQTPGSAHAVLTQNQNGSYTVSLRAPLDNKQGAGGLCSAFATGGGREAAAGINALDKSQLAEFIEAVEAYYRT